MIKFIFIKNKKAPLKKVRLSYHLFSLENHERGLLKT